MFRRSTAAATALALASLVSLVFFGCGTSDSSNNPTGSGASSADIQRCKGGCDKMKFFRCSSAAEQARCYDECDKAPANKIEVFTACAETSICDPECRTTITPAPAGTSSGGGVSGGGVSGGGATPDSCATACQKLISCSFIKLGDKTRCIDVCQKEAYQFQIDCVNGNECSAIPKACGAVSGGGEPGGVDAGATFEIQRCQAACDSAQFFGCLDAAKHATCRDKCAAVAASTRDSYSSCANGAGGDCTKQADCYSQLTK